eukprot:6348786-Prymnesium_polylepis.1
MFRVMLAVPWRCQLKISNLSSVGRMHAKTANEGLAAVYMHRARRPATDVFSQKPSCDAHHGFGTLSAKISEKMSFRLIFDTFQL